MRRIALILELTILLVACGGAVYKYMPHYWERAQEKHEPVRISPVNTPGLSTDGCPPLLEGCTCAISQDGKPEPMPPAKLKYMLPEDCISY